MSRLRIVLGDLRHCSVGRHSIFMPVGIGYIAAYALERFGDAVEIRIHDEPEKLLADVKAWKPDVLGLSCYCWNARLAELVFAKAKGWNPKVLCVAGGPHYSAQGDLLGWFRARPQIDFFAPREGEKAFAGLLERLLGGESIAEMKSLGVPGFDGLHPDMSRVVRGENIQKIMDLDDIPSPYLAGIMDPFFDGAHAPCFETARGCPHTCGYCWASSSWYGAVSFFSVARIAAELDYMAERMGGREDIPLSICDSNFGSFPRDEAIVDHMVETIRRHGWPKAYDVTTGKTGYDRILRISRKLDGRMHVCTSLQSKNDETLKIIRRKNLADKDFKRISEWTRSQGGATVTEFILPMPKETKATFIEGLRYAIGAGTASITPYTTMMLPQTPIASDSMRSRYGLKTRFRILPHSFGEYEGKRCLEYEEVCVESDTLPFADYLECRGIGLVLKLFSGPSFDVVRRMCLEHGIDYLDVLEASRGLMQTQCPQVAADYAAFLRETEEELLASPEDLEQFFSREENYKKLLSGELGDNLLRRYTIRLLLKFPSVVGIVCKVLERFCPPKEVLALKQWLLATRDIRRVVFDQEARRTEERLTCDYDVEAWRAGKLRLADYPGPVHYVVRCDEAAVEKLLGELRTLYGQSMEYRIAKCLVHHPPNLFWRQATPAAGN